MCVYFLSPPRLSHSHVFFVATAKARGRVPPKKAKADDVRTARRDLMVTDSHAYTIKGKHLEKDGIEGKT